MRKTVEPTASVVHQAVQPHKVSTAPLPLAHATVQRALANPRDLAPNDILQLQRTVGNRAVSNLLRGQGSNIPSIQAKLQVGPAHDKYEDEAERMAGQTAQRQPAPHVYAPKGGTAPQGVEQGVRAARGNGSALPTTIRRSMEGALDTDLGGVRVHTDQRADVLNRSLSASAFTTGKDLFFRKGEYQPNSGEGRSLLAHELTHVKQQRGGVQQRGVERAPIIQREISSKSAKLDSKWNEMWADGDRASDTKKYYDSFNTKPADKAARKKQKAEKTALTKLLHYEKGDHGADKPRRLLIRSILVAEAGAGAELATLAEFKKFLNDNPSIELRHLRNYWSSEFSLSDPATPLLAVGAKWGASDKLMNLFTSHSAKYRWELLEEQRAPLVANVQAISTRADNATKQGNPVFTGMLIYKRRQMLRLISQLQQFVTQQNLYRAKITLPHAEQEYRTVLELTLKVERSTSAYSSGAENAPAKQLGGGAFSKVYEVHYDKKLSPNPNKLKITHGVFKQELTKYSVSTGPAASDSGIQHLNPNFTGRSIATYKLDKLMGMGVTPKTKVGTHAGMSGSVQEWVAGAAPQKTVTTNDHGVDIDTMYNRDFNMDDPEVQRQLATLQLLDVITGQVDRHEGNYFIYQGPNGTQVKSIDNDLAFGKDKNAGRLQRPTGGNLAEDSSRGMPLFVDKDVADRILATTPAQIKNVVQKQGLSDAEISKTLERFAQVKQHLNFLGANSVRLRVLHQQYNAAMARQQNLQNRANGPQDDDLEPLRQEIRDAQAKGAIITKGAWGKMTAKYSTPDNSYFARAARAIEDARQTGKLIGKDE